MSLATGQIKIRTDLARSSASGASISAGGNYSDQVTFAINQAPSEFIEVGVRMRLAGEMYGSEEQGVRSFATFNAFLLSSEGGVGRDTLGGVREYGAFLTTAVPIPATVWLFGSGLALFGSWRQVARK